MMQRQENLMFADAGMAAKHVTPMVTYKPDVDKAAGLGSFLERPVAINVHSWPEGPIPTLMVQFNPWQLFFNTPSIKNKITNFARLRAKLHLKFVVNASPFYYGAMRVCYCPIDGGFRDIVESVGDQIKFSQMPGDFIYPQDMTSMEMELPFLWPHAWLDLNRNEDFDLMGQISYILYSQLRSANGTTGSNVTITCYAWATDVELAGLTSGLVLQGDEYDSAGLISGPATAVANVAAKLTDAPIIGSLARATEIGARAVGGIASLFGYSNPPVMHDVMPFQPKAFHSFANVETSIPMDKLTIDPKNEITVDKSVTGASPDDELIISHFCARKSFITGALWTEAYAPGTQLLRFPVTPRNYGFNPVTGQNLINNTPASHCASMFSQWRGGIVYTMRFVKTRYHTGRIQISWDPQEVPLTNAETTTMTRVVDLQMETEVTFIVPYKAQDPWLNTGNTGNNWSNSTSGTVTSDRKAFNGYVRVTVLNELTGPSASQQIDVLLFCHTAPDFQLAQPNETPLWSFLSVQSMETEDQLVDVGVMSVPVDTNVITVGETVVSLRTLLHRTSFYHRQLLGNPFSASGVYEVKRFYNLVNYIPRFPVDYGYSTNGVNYATGILVPTKNQFQYSPTHPLNWITNCFAGYRGSIVHQYNVISNGQPLPDQIVAERDPRSWIIGTAPAQAINRFSTGAVTIDQSTISRAPVTTQSGVNRGIWGQRGMAITNANTQSALSVVTPQYSRWKFRPAYAKTRDVLGSYDEVESIKLVTSMRCGSSSSADDEGWPIVDIFMAGGVDFDPIFFICVPTLYSFITTSPDNSY